MLKGERVLLRSFQAEDAVRQHEFDQRIELYGLDSDTPHVRSMAETQAFVESRMKGDPNTAGFAISIEGVYVGHCALYHVQDRHGNFELGITIGDPAYWGQGYGRETVELLLRYAFYYLGGRRVELTTNAKNERAIRCYRACGFIEEGRPRKVVWIEGEYTDLVQMSILRDEWQEQS